LEQPRVVKAAEASTDDIKKCFALRAFTPAILEGEGFLETPPLWLLRPMPLNHPLDLVKTRIYGVTGRSGLYFKCTNQPIHGAKLMKQTIPLILALLCLAAPAAAQRPPPMHATPPNFAEFDADGDGLITEQEFIDARNRRIAERAGEGRQMRGLENMEEFKDIDTDGDGTISAEEFTAHQQRHMQDRPNTRGPGRR